jgi:hypothetical protein
MTEELPKREAGTHLPRAAYRVANVDPDRWHVSEQDVRVLLNALRRWQITARR